MQEPRDEFLEQIKSTLLGHEEPYKEGAWERFATKNISTGNERKKVIPIWKWTAAAAAVLIGAVLLLQYFNAPDTGRTMNGDSGSVVKTDVNKQPSKDSQAILTDTNNVMIATVPDNHVPKNNSNIITPQNQYTPSPIIRNILKKGEVAAKTDNTQVPPTPVPTPAPPVIAQAQNQAPQKPQPRPAEDKPVNKPFWKNGIEENVVATKPVPQNNNAVAVNRQPEQRVRKEDKSSKWLSSLYVSPNFSSEGVNMGYGYSLGYAINDKIRVSSGVAYTKVSTSKDFDAPAKPNTLAMDATIGVSAFARSAMASSSVAAPSTPYVQSVESWISGIDVPVEVTYSVNNKVYATGGVSGLFIMNGENTSKVLSDLNSRAPVTNAKGDVKGYSSLAEESKPAYQKSSNANTSFLGFYNVSMGYKQKVTNKNSVSVEPFVKIPMKKISQQNLNYTGVGVRLKFDF